MNVFPACGTGVTCRLPSKYGTRIQTLFLEIDIALLLQHLLGDSGGLIQTGSTLLREQTRFCISTATTA